MRYIEIMTERDQKALIQSLERMINHPDTPKHERENAIRALGRIQGDKSAHKVGADDLEDFGATKEPKNKGTHKMGSDDLQDFGAYTAKAKHAPKSTRGKTHNFTV